MSLLHLLHKTVIIKFADAAKSDFNPDGVYAFRLMGVDGMGFLQIQDLKPGNPEAPETSGEPYWINKDFVREIHEAHLGTAKGTILYAGPAAKPPVAAVKPEPKIDPAPRESAPKGPLPKAKIPGKKSVLKSKPVFN